MGSKPKKKKKNKDSWFSRFKQKKIATITLIIATLLLAVLLVGAFGFLLVQDMFAFGSFPANVSVCGVSIEGLTKTEAVEKCQKELSWLATRPVVVKVDGDEFQVSPEELGLELDYERMVNEAYNKAWNVNILERMGRRFISKQKPVNISLVTRNNQELIRKSAERLAQEINRTPQDAYVDVTAGTSVIVPDKTGREVSVEQIQAKLQETLGTYERLAEVEVTVQPAAVQDEMFGKIIVINLAAHKLSLFDRETIQKEYPIACGSPSWPSPAGQWKIVSKQRNPSWRNPGSSWAKSMPPYIPPGPGNPLGTRALALNASGVLVHGTYSSGSIGSSVSHGCIRMYIRDVEELFELVEVNTPVYIIRAAGSPGFDVTRRPFWW